MSVPTLTLADFLLARIAEDEAAGQAASFLRPSGPDPAFVSLADGLLRMQQRFDSPRVLAECEAKRRIVDDLGETGCEPLDYQGFAANRTLRALALPYADHPDYRDEWRP